MRSRNAVLGSIAALVVVAAAIGLLLVVRTVGEDEITLPDEVDGYVALDTARATRGGDVAQREQTLESQRQRSERNAEGWSEVFDAPAAVRAYIDLEGDGNDILGVTAVGADTGPLVPAEGFPDPEDLGLALPRNERITDGDVECVLSRASVPPAGKDYEPDQAEPASQVCQRRSGTLTVRVTSNSPDTDRVIGVVEDLWDELD